MALEIFEIYYFRKKAKKKQIFDLAFLKYRWCLFLVSHQVPLALPSAIAGLTAEFGMGSGVSPLLSRHQNFKS